MHGYRKTPTVMVSYSDRRRIQRLQVCGTGIPAEIEFYHD